MITVEPLLVVSRLNWVIHFYSAHPVGWQLFPQQQQKENLSNMKSIYQIQKIQIFSHFHSQTGSHMIWELYLVFFMMLPLDTTTLYVK